VGGQIEGLGGGAALGAASPRLQARLAGLAGLTWARVGSAYRGEPIWLELNRFDLPVRDLPPAFRGLKVAHLTDFHYGRQIPPGYIEGALERTLAEKPDLIALTGDFIDRGPRYVEKAAKLFCHLRAPLGVYAELASHDSAVPNARGVRRHAAPRSARA